MADFNIEFEKVIKHEGVYGNDPTDRGGETVYGVSRKNFPNQPLWVVVDKLKVKNGDNGINSLRKLIQNEMQIMNNVKYFYKTVFWDKFKLDSVRNQKIASLIFDTAVNTGISAAAKFAQEKLGLKVTGRITEELIEKLRLMV